MTPLAPAVMSVPSPSAARAQPIHLYVAVLASLHHPTPPNSHTIILEVVYEPERFPQIGADVSLHLLQATVINAHKTSTPPFIPIPSFHFRGRIVGERSRSPDAVVFVARNGQGDTPLKWAHIHIRTIPGGIAPCSAALVAGLNERLRSLAEPEYRHTGGGDIGPIAPDRPQYGAPPVSGWPDRGRTTAPCHPYHYLPPDTSNSTWTATTGATGPERWSVGSLGQVPPATTPLAMGWDQSGPSDELRILSARAMTFRNPYGRPAALHPTREAQGTLQGFVYDTNHT
ncbi:hypothetical protein OH77DRAFT_1427889 [Trametes cingulata]|nr:hypothetical protein OH77DRAFT_1427889 [Trametes cingulata]